MSIRLLARELYRLQQQVHQLEKELAAAPSGSHDRVKERLRQARAERDRMQRMLDGRLDRSTKG